MRAEDRLSLWPSLELLYPLVARIGSVASSARQSYGHRRHDARDSASSRLARAAAKYLWLLAMKGSEISIFAHRRSEAPAQLVIMQQDSLWCISAACTKMCG